MDFEVAVQIKRSVRGGANFVSLRNLLGCAAVFTAKVQRSGGTVLHRLDDLLWAALRCIYPHAPVDIKNFRQPVHALARVDAAPDVVAYRNARCGVFADLVGHNAMRPRELADSRAD